MMASRIIAIQINRQMPRGCTGQMPQTLHLDFLPRKVTGVRPVILELRISPFNKGEKRKKGY